MSADDLYKNIWKCFQLRIENKCNKTPLEAILPTMILATMNQIEVEHLRERYEEAAKP